MQKPTFFSWPFIVLGVTITWLASYFSHGLFPIDETRYAAVAWEMWHRHSFLVPSLNGELYSHKPPLLFWLMHLGWAIFGVNDAWPRMLPFLLGLSSIGLIAHLNKLLNPSSTDDSHEKNASPLLAALLLAGSFAWLVDISLVMFDVLMTFCILLAWIGLVTAIKQQKKLFWLLYSFGLTGALLAKGPACFLYILSFGGFFIASHAEHKLKTTGLFLAYTLLGMAGAALWPLAIFLIGGETDRAYLYHLLWTQTADRVAHSFAHQRPFWWYLPWLPIFFLPWSLMPSTWRFFKNYRALWQDKNKRFLLLSLLFPILIFSCISGKQLHYLIPTLPLLSLLLAQTSISSQSFGKLAAASFITIASLQIVVAGQLYPRYDTENVGQLLHYYDTEQKPIGFFAGHYAGEFNFAGRLKQPIQSFSRANILQWSQKNLNGLVITSVREENEIAKGQALYFHVYRGKYLGVWPSERIAKNPNLADFLMRSGDQNAGKDQVDE